MPSHPDRRPPGRHSEDGASTVDEPMIGYEAALPYLQRGHGGGCCGSDDRQQDAPLSYSVARSPPMGPAGQDF